MQASYLTVILIVAVALTWLSGIESVAYNELCSSDSDCTGTNSNTTCVKEPSPTCTQGKCRCRPIFKWDSGASKCKLKKFYLDPCDDTMTSCMEGSDCIDGQCLCSVGTTFNQILRLCTNLKAVGENCTTVSDCYTSVTDAVECAVSSDECACKTGYVLEKGSCRLPRFGETCQPSPSCTSLVSSLDTSLITETCSTASTCSCPTGTTMEKILRDGKIYSVCLQTPGTSSTLKTVTEVCFQANQCSSKLCLSCPEFPSPGGTQQKQCVAQPTVITG